MNEFVAQIVAAPDDDRPRLVYADHLMERGDPQGELIAVQCALARHDATDEEVGDVPRLRVRERALLAAHGSAWSSAAGLADWQGQFRRGFLEEVRYKTGEAAVAQLDLLRVKAPLVRMLHVGEGGRHVARWPGAGFLNALYTDAAAATAIAQSTSLTALRRLAMRNADDDKLEACATVPQSLDALEIEIVAPSSAAVNRAMTDALVACEARACLASLSLSSIGAGLADLHRLPLRTLALRDATVPDGVLYSMSRRCPLVVLDIARTGNTKLRSTLDVASIVHAAPALRRLRLANVGITDAQVQALARTPNQLRRLSLERNLITDTGALALARSEHFRGLRYLELNGNKVGELARHALRSAFPGLHLLRS